MKNNGSIYAFQLCHSVVNSVIIEENRGGQIDYFKFGIIRSTLISCIIELADDFTMKYQTHQLPGSVISINTQQGKVLSTSFKKGKRVRRQPLNQQNKYNRNNKQNLIKYFILLAAFVVVSFFAYNFVKDKAYDPFYQHSNQETSVSDETGTGAPFDEVYKAEAINDSYQIVEEEPIANLPEGSGLAVVHEVTKPQMHTSIKINIKETTPSDFREHLNVFIETGDRSERITLEHYLQTLTNVHLIQQSNGNTYIGETKQGVIHGLGVHFYATSTSVSEYLFPPRFIDQDHFLVGEWHEGRLYMGRVYDSLGNITDMIIIGKK